MKLPNDVKVKLAQQGGATVYRTFIETAVFPDGTSMPIRQFTTAVKNLDKSQGKAPRKKVVFEKQEDIEL